MNCEFNLCIYNWVNHCILNEININAYGMCDSCVLPDIPASLIDELKQNRLESLTHDESDYIY